MQVICICGQAGSGKDTVAIYMKKYMEEYLHKVLITHYADLLKYICKTFLGWDGKKDENGRSLLQEVGQAFREKDGEYWVKFVETVLSVFKDKWDYVLIPDTRFDNECEIMASDFQPVLIKVERSNYESSLTDEQKEDVSENGITKCKPKLVIYNNGDLNDLEKQVAVMTGYIMGVLDHA